MTRDEWAALLASLCDDGARRDALLMLSDEDWVREGDRDWLRRAALRELTLMPAGQGRFWMFDSYEWEDDRNKRAVIPRAAGLRLRKKEHDILDYTEPYPSRGAAWSDLLQAISKGDQP